MCKSGKTRSRKSGRCRKAPCSPGMIRNRSTGRCRTKCIPGQYRSIKSGRCRNKSSPKSSPKSSSNRKYPLIKSRSRKPPCKKPGQTRSKTSGKCRKPPCGPGMIRNKSNGRCRKKCIPGQYRSIKSGRCRTKCLPGYYRDKSGRCVPKKSGVIYEPEVVSSRGIGSYLEGVTDDVIDKWAKSGIMISTKSGYVPPPASRKSGNLVWSSATDERPASRSDLVRSSANDERPIALRSGLVRSFNDERPDKMKTSSQSDEPLTIGSKINRSEVDFNYISAEQQEDDNMAGYYSPRYRKKRYNYE